MPFETLRALPAPAFLIVVDDSLSAQDADSLRDAGLGLTDPGREAHCPAAIRWDASTFRGLVPVVSRLVGGQLRPINAHAKSASSVPTTWSQGRVHIDGPAEWSGSL